MHARPQSPADRYALTARRTFEFASLAVIWFVGFGPWPCLAQVGGAVPAARPGIGAAPIAQPDGGSPSTRLFRREEVSDGISGKVLRYAAKLVDRYDADLDGRLQESEWRRMAGTPRLADLDGDGVLTVEELAQRVASYSRQRTLRLMPARRDGDNGLAEAGTAGETDESAPMAAPGEAPTEEETAEADDMDPMRRASDEERKRPPKPFYVPPSRLPKGVAAWFTKRDRNGDGQVTMVEYASQWSPAEALEFARYDTDGDGIITAAECAAASGKRSEPSEQPASGASDEGMPTDTAADAAAAP